MNPSGEGTPSGGPDKTSSRNPKTGKILLIEEGYQIFEKKIPGWGDYAKRNLPHSPETIRSLADRARRDYPDFFEIPDIVSAFKKAEKANVPLDILTAVMEWDLGSRKYKLATSPAKSPSTIESKKAKKALKEIEEVQQEIDDLTKAYLQGIFKTYVKAVDSVRDFPLECLDQYDKNFFLSFLAPLLEFPEDPSTSVHSIVYGEKNIRYAIEKVTAPLLDTLKGIREALIATAEPEKDRILAVMHRDPEYLKAVGKGAKRRGPKIDHFENGIIVKYSTFFRMSTGNPQDGIARAIVAHLILPMRPERAVWLDDKKKPWELTKLYKQAREHAEGHISFKRNTIPYQVVFHKYFGLGLL